MMRHVYIRGILALIWLVAAIVSGVSGNLEMTALYVNYGQCVPVFGLFHMEKGKERKRREIRWIELF